MSLKLLPLQGWKSLVALNGFHSMLLGVKMLPLYQEVGYEEFFMLFKDMSPEQQEKILRQGVAFVQMKQDEVEAILSFVVDANGIPFSDNLRLLKPGAIVEGLIAVAMEFGRIEVGILSEDEKKKFPTSASTSDAPT